VAAGSAVFVNAGSLIVLGATAANCTATAGSSESSTGIIRAGADATPVFNYAGFVNGSPIVGPIGVMTPTTNRLTVTVSTDTHSGGAAGTGAGLNNTVEHWLDLRAAIHIASTNPGDNSILLDCGTPCVIALNGPLPPIMVPVTINGGTFGKVYIDGANQYRVFFVDHGAVTIENLQIQRGMAKGGDGGAGFNGGGGGAGLGGCLFINQSTANVTLTGVRFAGCSATGGAGGSFATSDAGGAGGAGSPAGSGAIGYLDNAPGANGTSLVGGLGGFGGGGGGGFGGPGGTGGAGGFGGGGGGGAYGANGGPGAGGGGGVVLAGGSGGSLGTISGGNGSFSGGGGGAAAGPAIFINDGKLHVDSSVAATGSTATGGMGANGSPAGASAVSVFSLAGTINGSAARAPNWSRRHIPSRSRCSPTRTRAVRLARGMATRVTCAGQSTNPISSAEPT
jgi:hypothetical protein